MGDDQERGLYAKYRVERTDGKPVGECIVLEFQDPLAHDAIRRWANDMLEAGYVQLSLDVVEALAELDPSLKASSPSMGDAHPAHIHDGCGYVGLCSGHGWVCTKCGRIGECTYCEDRIAALKARIAKAIDVGSNGEHSTDEYLMGEVLDALGANDG